MDFVFDRSAGRGQRGPGAKGARLDISRSDGHDASILNHHRAIGERARAGQDGGAADDGEGVTGAGGHRLGH